MALLVLFRSGGLAAYQCQAEMDLVDSQTMPLIKLSQGALFVLPRHNTICFLLAKYYNETVDVLENTL